MGGKVSKGKFRGTHIQSRHLNQRLLAVWLAAEINADICGNGTSDPIWAVLQNLFIIVWILCYAKIRWHLWWDDRKLHPALVLHFRRKVTSGRGRSQARNDLETAQTRHEWISFLLSPTLMNNLIKSSLGNNIYTFSFNKIYFGKRTLWTTGIKLEKDNINSLYTWTTQLSMPRK